MDKIGLISGNKNKISNLAVDGLIYGLVSGVAMILSLAVFALLSGETLGTYLDVFQCRKIGLTHARTAQPFGSFGNLRGFLRSADLADTGAFLIQKNHRNPWGARLRPFSVVFGANCFLTGYQLPAGTNPPLAVGVGAWGLWTGFGWFIRQEVSMNREQ